MRPLARLVAALALLLVLLVACGPISPPPGPNHFFVVFHNESNTAQTVTVKTALQGAYTGIAAVGTVQPHTAASFDLGTGELDLVDVRAGWGSVAWSGPEISGTWVMNVQFPSGASWKGWP